MAPVSYTHLDVYKRQDLLFPTQTAMQTLFTGTVAKVASLIAIVVGGYQFAHGEPGAKKTLAGVAAGTGIAVLATNVLTWLWGV